MLADETALALAQEPSIMFVGSGISTASPSNLPSAYSASSTFLRRLSLGLLEHHIVDELLERRWVLPEFIYGLAERHFGPQVYSVWGSLEDWRSMQGTFSATASHLTIVDVAARWGTPILTPNFDTFLEDAAERLEHRARVAVAVPGQPFRPEPPAAGEVAIWKLHGTATDPTTVFSSVRALTRPTTGVREHLLRAGGDDARLVLAGYSGRDLDLFPLLSARSWRRIPIWVDINFGPDHRSRYLAPPARQVVATFDFVARQYTNHASARLRAAVQAADQRAAASGHNAAARALASRIERSFEAVADGLTNEVGRRLLFAELLINAGMSQEAMAVLEGIRSEDAQDTERARLQAKALWELGRFRSSREVAIARLRAGAAGPEKDVMRFAVTASEIREAVPPRGLPVALPVARRLLIRATIRALMTYLFSHRRAQRHVSIDEPTRTPFVEGRIEHGIRLLALTHVLIAGNRGVPRKLAARLLAPCWRAMHRSSTEAGYAEGIGNCARYLARLGLDDPDGVHAAHEFLGHSLGVAISHRDIAQRALMDGDEERAREAFARGREIAEAQQDPVLLLTFEPLALKLGERWSADSSAIANIEADWAAAFLRWRRSSERRAGGAP